MRILIVLFSAALACAQNYSGVISGTVSDVSGAVVPGASVTIINAETNVVMWKGATDAAGLYVAPALPVSSYHVRFETLGFKKSEVRNVAVQVDQRVRVDSTLSPGELAESITVSGEAAGRLEMDTSSIGATINPSQISDMPLPGRNVLNLLTLVGGISSGGAATGINSSQLSINGSRTLNSEFTVDGMSVVVAATGNVGTLPSTDAIREIKIMTSGFGAEYGRTSGGSVAVMIASGTRAFHGGVYEYFRNEKLNANNFFNNVRGQERPSDRYNQFGGKLGGPVWLPKVFDGRESTFFFFNFEGLRRRAPANPISTIPDAAFRVGDFSTSPVPVHDPLANAPFPGNRIPLERIDPAAAKIMGLLPAPNSSGSADAASGRRINNYVNSQSTSPGADKYTGRLDHSIGTNIRLFGSVNRYENPNPTAVTIPGLLNPAGGDVVTTGAAVNIGYTHVWSPTLVSESRIGFHRDYLHMDPPTLGVDPKSALGMERAITDALPRFTTSGWADLGMEGNTYKREISNTWQYTTSLTWVHSAHVLKGGFQLRKNQFNVYNPGGNWSGIYAFNGEMTASNKAGGNPVNALADFLIGNVQTANYALPQPMTGRRNFNAGAFIQDDWKVARKLTLNLGLRYEYEAPVRMANHMYSRVDPLSGKLLVAGKNASETLNLEGDKLNFAPRIGLAYNVTEKTVIRAAFGVFYSQIFSNLGGVVAYPGYTVQQSFPDLGVGVAQGFSLRQGMPLLAVQNLDDPFFVERQATVSNPLSPGAQYGEVSPLTSTLQWNFGIQRDIGAGFVVDASYVASRGLHVPISLSYNTVPFERGVEVAAAGTAAATQLARPFPTVGGINSFFHAGTSNYHSLQIKTTRQFTKGFGVMGIYTFAKATDDGSGVFNYSQPNGLDQGQFPHLFRYLDKALSAFDRRHSFALAVQYTTGGPRWLRGIEINPIVTARDGLLDTITQSNLYPSATQQRPSVSGTNGGGYAPEMTSEGTAMRYLLSPSDPNFPFVPVGPLFAGSGASRKLVLPFTMGTLGRNTMRSPGEFNIDLSVARRFRIGERLIVQLRGEAFNFLNGVSFNTPSTGLSVVANAANEAVWNSPGFGLITSAKSARFMQLVARFEF